LGSTWNFWGISNFCSFAATRKQKAHDLGEKIDPVCQKVTSEATPEKAETL